MADLSDINMNPYTIPPGWYNVVATESSIWPIKSCPGRRLEFTFYIEDGPHAGEFIRDGFNIEHPSANAVQIALAKLSVFCRAVGIKDLRNASELLDLPLKIKVENRDGYTNIIGYTPR